MLFRVVALAAVAWCGGYAFAQRNYFAVGTTSFGILLFLWVIHVRHK